MFKEVYLPNSYDDNMFNSDGTINSKYNSFKKTGLISQILEDHWDEFCLHHYDTIQKYRPNAFKEVQKVIDCMNKNLGCNVYECPECHDVVFVANTCKSRMCTSCGYKYKMIRVENILQNIYNCNHRQIVFTIPKELRSFFYSFRYMDLLFDAVCQTIYSIFNIKYKKDKKGRIKKYVSKIKYLPGFYSFLHTFGRDMKWNPHIHVLLAELKIGVGELIKKIDYFDFDALSKRFQKILYDLMDKNIPEFTQIIKNTQYEQHKNGLYVYAEKKKFKHLKDGIEYVTRYCGRPCISENRIISYDDESVTFSYIDHYDNLEKTKTVSALEFISLLLDHIIPHNYRTIRSFGFYHTKSKADSKIVKLISQEKQKIRRQFLKFEISILKSFNRNPLYCSHCDVKMNLLCLVT